MRNDTRIDVYTGLKYGSRGLVSVEVRGTPMVICAHCGHMTEGRLEEESPSGWDRKVSPITVLAALFLFLVLTGAAMWWALPSGASY